ncbi:hypothetical protein TNCV_3974861 [Trichonephila clavipes]|nr:hypothetical protein TNCV_3974861 [Trichonephila clavipes]
MLQIDKVQIPPECCKRGKGMLTPTEEVEVPPTAPKRFGVSPPSTSQEHAPERRTLHGLTLIISSVNSVQSFLPSFFVLEIGKRAETPSQSEKQLKTFSKIFHNME